MRITRCKTYKGGMAQRELNNKTIRHYVQVNFRLTYENSAVQNLFQQIRGLEQR
jgi:hypothetical protein